MYGKATVHPIVTRFLLLIDEACHQHATIPALPAIARQLGVSVSHLQHLVRRDLGSTYTRLIRARCVQHLKALLLEQPDQTISEIAYQCGYDPQTMRRHFTTVLGACPSAIRKIESRN